MQEIKIEKLNQILSKDMDKKSLEKATIQIEEKFPIALDLIKTQGSLELQDKVKILMLLGLGRDRTISYLSEYKVNRDHIKSARESMNEEQTEFRLENEKYITNRKIESTKRSKRFKHFKESNVKWEDIAERYSNGEALHKIAKEYNLKMNYITEQLKDDGIHDETRSTLLKNKLAMELERKIDDKFIVELVNDNPLDSKDQWWEKAKEKYPWLLRKQMYEKLVELGLERTQEEVNRIRSIKGKGANLLNKTESPPKSLNRENAQDLIKRMKDKSLKQIRKKMKATFKDNSIKEIDSILVDLGIMEQTIVSSQEVNAITKAEVERVFGSVKNLVEFYLKGRLGSYSKIADIVNLGNKNEVKVSRRQIEKIITRDPSYKPKKSIPETQLYEFTKDIFSSFEVVREELIPGTMKRIDVFIKDLNVGLEFNGDYYHSDEVIMQKFGKSSEEHHRERAEEATSHGIKLVYIWEIDWNVNYSEVEDAIANQDWDNPLLNRYSNSDYYRRD